jgi:ankyrin repeat protein
VAAGEKDIVLYLLEKGADPNVRENSGYTPLHIAAQNGDVDIIRALLFNGADLQAIGEDGKKPLDMAIERDHKEAILLLKQGITRRFRSMRPRLNNT